MYLCSVSAMARVLRRLVEREIVARGVLMTCLSKWSAAFMLFVLRASFASPSSSTNRAVFGPLWLRRHHGGAQHDTKSRSTAELITNDSKYISISLKRFHVASRSQRHHKRGYPNGHRNRHRNRRLHNPPHPRHPLALHLPPKTTRSKAAPSTRR